MITKIKLCLNAKFVLKLSIRNNRDMSINQKEITSTGFSMIVTSLTRTKRSFHAQI